MQIQTTALPGVTVITPARHGDSRGFFSESWNRRSLDAAGLHLPDFVQDNHSVSRHAGTLCGMHYQAPPHAQGKLVRCGRGALFDVAVDVRRGSPTWGQWVGVDLSFENGRQLWIPAGFLHGFVTRQDDTEIVYKCTDHYDPDCDGAVVWDSLGIDWGGRQPHPVGQGPCSPRVRRLAVAVFVAGDMKLLLQGARASSDRRWCAWPLRAATGW